MSLFCRITRHPTIRWVYWCFKFKQIVPWSVRFIGIPKCHPITEDDIEYAKNLEAFYGDTE